VPANILNFPQYRVLRVASSCPHCQSDRLTSWGTREQVFKDLLMHGKRVGIYIDTRRLRC